MLLANTVCMYVPIETADHGQHNQMKGGKTRGVLRNLETECRPDIMRCRKDAPHTHERREQQKVRNPDRDRQAPRRTQKLG